MLVAVFGMAFAANAQSDQCKLESGNGGYIEAYVGSDKSCMQWEENPRISITTQPSKEQPSGGTVLCKITYERLSDGKRETVTRTLKFSKNGSYENSYVYIDSPAKRIVSIEIWSAECSSVNRNNY